MLIFSFSPRYQLYWLADCKSTSRRPWASVALNLFIYFKFQINIITRCQGLNEKHLQTPLKTKIKATQHALNCLFSDISITVSKLLVIKRLPVCFTSYLSSNYYADYNPACNADSFPSLLIYFVHYRWAVQTHVVLMYVTFTKDRR